MPYGSVNADLMTTSDGVSSSGLYGFKNRLINSAMVIDQRNAGASVTPNGTYTLDRWFCPTTQTSKFTVQQNAGSVTPPTGFSNYLGVTSSSSYSVNSTDVFAVRQIIEGFNSADLTWGTANAQPITISFWVRSSLTGTFGLGLGNSGFSRAYPASYTISSANTWEYKTVTVAGDTTGTWLTTNGAGIQVTFCLGFGSSYLGTANAWNAGTVFMPTGATSVVGTNGATLYITGVQLEKGSTATSFDYRPYSAELAMCQRYYYLHANGTTKPIGMGAQLNSTEADCIVPFPVTMRTTPSLSSTSGTDYYRFSRGGGDDNFNSLTIDNVSTQASRIYNATEISGTAGQAGLFITNNASAFVAWSAEL